MDIRIFDVVLNEYFHNELKKIKTVVTDIEKLDNADNVSKLFKDVFKLDIKAEEYIYLVATNNKFKVLGIFEVSHGTADTALINSRGVFIRLLLCGASSFFLVHNHPTQDSTPSNEDVQLTKKLGEAAKLMGIKFTDHIIIGEEYTSMRKLGIL